MSRKPPHILFVSHNANRGGAPLLLLEIVKAFSLQSDIPFRVLLMHNGDLADDFTKLGKTHIWFRRHLDNRYHQKRNSLTDRFLTGVRGLFILYSVRKSTIVFYNTITNGHIHKKLLFLKARSICYVHELEAAIRITTNAQTRQTLRDHTHLFLAVSQAVKDNLVSHHAVDEMRIRVMRTPFRYDAGTYHDTHGSFSAGFRREHGLQENTVIVGIMGQSEWRKGFDLFFPLVKLYFRLYPNDNVFFVWKGFSEKNLSAFFDLYRQEKYGLAGKAIVLPHGSDGPAVMSCYDIHVLLSREDPYPLVVLEAGSRGIPTVCFSDGGGAPEFVEDDAGACIPYGDLLGMAEAIKQLAGDREKRQRMGCCARLKADRHAFEKTIPAFISAIEGGE